MIFGRRPNKGSDVRSESESEYYLGVPYCNYSIVPQIPVLIIKAPCVGEQPKPSRKRGQRTPSTCYGHADSESVCSLPGLSSSIV